MLGRPTTFSIGLVIISMVPGFARQSWASHFQDIYSFNVPDVAYPAGGLLAAPNGVLYGVSLDGGIGGGSAFSLTTPSTPEGSWTEAMIFVFGAGFHAPFFPVGELIEDASGDLYGLTDFGGTGLNGTIYELSPSGGGFAETTLWNFNGADGAEPDSGALRLGSDGVGAELQGAVTQGGSNNLGTVFVLPIGGTLRTLHNFGSNPGDGANPHAGLIAGEKGIFGTTLLGGVSGCGTVFSASGIAGVIYSFEGPKTGPDGCEPGASLVSDSSGVIYGTTWFGGAYGNGTVFSLTPPATVDGSWTENVLYSFAGGLEGSVFPTGQLVFGRGGVLYGTTLYGGSASQGTIFSLTPPPAAGQAWTETVLHTFTGKDGVGPLGLAPFHGVFYGVTSGGGRNGFGAAFGLTP